MEINSSRRLHLYMALGLLLAAISGITLYVYIGEPKNGGLNSNEASLTMWVEVEDEEGRDIPLGWREYVNTFYKFSILYKDGMTVTEFDEGVDAATIAFKDPKNLFGFQIFITPYSQSVISDIRFKSDVPSGIRNNIEKTSVGSVEAVAFESHDEILGDTREVWFIRGGYLYEVTSLKIHEAMLSEVLRTLIFK